MQCGVIAPHDKITMYAVLTKNKFCRFLHTFVWRQNNKYHVCNDNYHVCDEDGGDEADIFDLCGEQAGSLVIHAPAGRAE